MLRLILFVFVFSLLNVATYARSNVVEFTPVFVDLDNGLSWGAALQESYTNGCWVPIDWDDRNECAYQVIHDGEYQVIAEQSDAAKACSRLGARLPTSAEYESLLKQFDHTLENFGPSLTLLGFDQMNSVFVDLPNQFWTSSVVTPDQSSHAPSAAVFAGSKNYYFPGIITSSKRYWKLAVRCVH